VQPTLFQPIGGMDKIVDAFVARVGKDIRYNAEALEIVNGAAGVDVAYRDRKSGNTTRVQADYCLINLPLARLVNLKTNLAGDFTRAAASAKNVALYKLAWQAIAGFGKKRRTIFTAASATRRTRSRKCGIRRTAIWRSAASSPARIHTPTRPKHMVA